MIIFIVTHVVLLFAIFLSINFMLTCVYECINYYKQGKSEVNSLHGFLVAVFWAGYIALLML